MRDGGNTNKEVMLVKTLLTITALVSFLSVASSSFGFDNMSLYKEPPSRVQIAREVNRDHVEEDYMDFYIDTLHPQLKEVNPEPILIAERTDQEESEGDFIRIFGVQVLTNS